MTKARQRCISLQEKACVYCQQACATGETCLAVLGSSGYTSYTDIFEMPLAGFMNQKYTLVHFPDCDAAQRCALCLRPACSSCTSSPDSFLAHKECLDMRASIIPGNASCEEVWFIGVATRPWFMPAGTVFKPAKGELEILFPQLEDEVSGTKKLVRKLLSLPDELFRMIMWEMADRSSLARISLVSQFSPGLIGQLKRKRALSTLDFANNHSMSKFAFLGVQYQPFLKDVHSITQRSVIRLGVDHLGIRSTEILEDYPMANRLGSCPWYIVERLCHARHHFKLVTSGPFLRMASRGHEKVQLWNVMNPPESGSYLSAGRFSTSPRRTRCIHMSGVTGLTVFCDSRSIYGIHAHRADESAIDAYRTLYPAFQHTAMWRYFPLRAGEVITKAWIRANSSFTCGTILVISTSRDRQCFLGACGEREQGPYQVLCDIQMNHLLYDDPAPGGSITWFGAAPRPSSISYADPEGGGTDPDLHHTCASLKDVIHAELYSDDQGASTGVLFRYLDGSSECIGQRRVGLSTTKITKVNHPNRIHFRTFELRTYDHRMLSCRRQCVEIQFSISNSDLRLDHWLSQDMAGNVTWSFTLRKDILQFSIEP